MKKCPECGNPSYDGAPACGNCGYKFPKPKPVAPKVDNIFKESEIIHKSESEDILTILYENRLVIGIILLITIIAIVGIVLTGSGNNPTPLKNLVNYSEADFSFNYPISWKKSNYNDSYRDNSVILEKNGTTIQFYNVTNEYSSLKELTMERISNAQYEGNYIDTIQNININKKNASDVILVNENGNYTRYVSFLDNGKVYVFKIVGNNVKSSEISNILNSFQLN